MDSIPIEVCHPCRAHPHKVFHGQVLWGKNSMGWHYDFQLHWIISDRGRLLAAFKLTPANTDDCQPVPDLTQNLDQLKNIGQIEQSRHRSVFIFLVNLLTGLVAYPYQNKKPSLDLEFKGLPALPPAIF